MSDIDKNYVAKYLDKAEATNDEAIKDNCLYRVGTQMEIIECDGKANFTPEERETITNAAKDLLKDE